GSAVTNQNTPLTFSLANGNAIQVSDVDANGSMIQVNLTGSNGTISLAATAGLTFALGDGSDDVAMTFTGQIASINAALNGLVFNPTRGFNGSASLTITTNELGNTGGGGPLSDADSVTITVNPSNQRVEADLAVTLQ